MPTYIIEREIPGAGQLSDDELRGITTKSNEVVSDLSRPYTWRRPRPGAWVDAGRDR